MLCKQKLSIQLASLSLVNSWIVKMKSMLGADWRATSTHIFWVIRVIGHFCQEQLVLGLHSTRFLCTTCYHTCCRKPLTNSLLCLVYLDNLISFNENAASQTTLIARFALLFFRKQYLIGPLYDQPNITAYHLGDALSGTIIAPWTVVCTLQRPALNLEEHFCSLM